MEIEHVHNGGFEARGQDYGRDAPELYRCVGENTREDVVVGFAKPCFLYLNTGRVSMVPGISGNLGGKLPDCGMDADRKNRQL